MSWCCWVGFDAYTFPATQGLLERVGSCSQSTGRLRQSGMDQVDTDRTRWPVGSIGWLYGTIDNQNPSVGQIVAATIGQRTPENSAHKLGASCASRFPDRSISAGAPC